MFLHDFRKTAVLFMLMMMVLCAPPYPILAGADEAAPPAGRIIHFTGLVRIIPAPGTGEHLPTAGQLLHAGAMVRTGKNGWVSILMSDETLIQLNRNTRFTLKAVDRSAGWFRLRKIVPAADFKGQGSVYRLDRGNLWLRNQNPDARIGLETPFVSAGIRGTEITARIDADDSVIFSVLAGWIQARNAYGTSAAGPGELIYAAKGTAPETRILVSPQNAVQWTLTLPKLDISDTDTDPAARPDRFRKVKTLLAMRDFTAAEQQLRELTRKQPDYGPGWSLLSLVLLAGGEAGPAQVLAAAEKGVAASPDSRDAFLVLGYAHQAGGDIKQAMDAADKALRIDPVSAEAMVAKARLLFGSNRTDEAFRLVASALQEAPAHAGALNLMGFLSLAMRDLQQAMISFQSAMIADPGMGEPHLGMGLLRMRQGDTAAAMEAVSTALLLEPRRSVFVSYWAKMLYQVKRFDRALQALDLAQRLDPLDPTPHLYQALVLRDLNRPTEAVAAINEAVRRNDNRAVYRSRFLLDRDLAVKNVDQSILFQELGLVDWARSKALASVKTDYHNAAGHTFLAGSLLAMENRLRSGSSENLLGLLLQPANLNALNTFQDYTAFFEAPAVNGVLTGLMGNHDTYQAEAIVHGAAPAANTAFNTIVNHSETGGWQDTNSDRSAFGGLSLKWDPTPVDGMTLLASVLQTTARGRQIDPYEYDAPASPDDRRETCSWSATLGYRRHLSPDADLLFMAKHLDRRHDTFSRSYFWLDPAQEFILFHTSDDRLDQLSDQVQAHFLYRRDDHQLIFGLLQQWWKRRVTADAFTEYWGWYDGWWYDLGSETDITDHTVHDHYQSAYIQDIWQMTSWMTVEAALYFDRLKYHNLYTAVPRRMEEILPRLGLIFTPTDRDTIRVAGFEYLTPFNIERLDPTDIAGIPLFRNSFNNTLTREYDLSWERDWSSGYAGITLFYLESRTKETFPSGGTESWSANIRGVEPVLNQILGHGLGLGVRYRFLDIDNTYSPEKDRKDHLISASLNCIRPNGLFAGISQTFRQEDFTRSSRDTEHIWLTDLTLGYRFAAKKGRFQIDVRNLFDNRFNWVVDDMVFDGRVPSREIFLRLAFFF